MKKILLVLAVLATVSFSCSKSASDVTPEITKGKEYTVNLGMNIQVVDVPMESGETKAAMKTAAEDDMKNLYGIQVYSYPASESHIAEINSTIPYGEITPYAYGLFNDKSKMSIKMLEGYKYVIVVKCIIDGVDIIQQHYLEYNMEYTENVYEQPFTLNEDPNYIASSNSFFYSNSKKFNEYDFYRGQFSLTNKTSIYKEHCYDTASYYGRVEDYIPSENGNIDLKLKRADFGVKYIIEGLIEGSLSVKLDKADDRIIGIDTIPKVLMYTHQYSHPTYTDGYTEEILLSVSWIKKEGETPIPLYAGKLKFKTRTIKNITLKVEDTSVDGTLSLTIENSNMDEENITISAGDITDNDITTD